MKNFTLYVADWSAKSKELLSMVETVIPQLLPEVSFTLVPLKGNEELHSSSAIRIYPTIVSPTGRRTNTVDLVELTNFLKDE